MEELFWNVLRQQVEAALKAEVSREALISLLKIGDPNLTEDDLDNMERISSSFRKLNKLIHPDKHKSDAACTKLFQNVHSFYESCRVLLDQPKTKKRRTSRGYGSPHFSFQQFPSDFHVTEKWPFLFAKEPTFPSKTRITAEVLAMILAYKCMNSRGAMAHGKEIGVCYGYEEVLESLFVSVKDVFDDLGGTKMLESVEDIKLELMTRGPVVSASFHLTQSFLSACEHSRYFKSSMVGKCHPILIVGWRLSAFGEVWLVRSFRGPKDVDIPIAIGQFAMEDEVLAPMDDFSNVSWQDESRAVDVNFSHLKDNWYTWSNITFDQSITELGPFFGKLGCSFSTALSQRTKFLVRDAQRKARSRNAYLTDISWDDENNRWKVNATFSESVG